jgi:hypothetical protein
VEHDVTMAELAPSQTASACIGAGRPGQLIDTSATQLDLCLCTDSHTISVELPVGRREGLSTLLFGGGMARSGGRAPRRRRETEAGPDDGELRNDAEHRRQLRDEEELLLLHPRLRAAPTGFLAAARPSILPLPLLCV